jgi:hypothetical protein
MFAAAASPEASLELSFAARAKNLSLVFCLL